MLKIHRFASDSAADNRKMEQQQKNKQKHFAFALGGKWDKLIFIYFIFFTALIE